MPAMKLVINGEAKDVAAVTLADLVAQLGMKPDRVAVELNREIVPRDRWTNTTLKDGDKLEIVHFVGGGAIPSADEVRRFATRYAGAWSSQDPRSVAEFFSPTAALQINNEAPCVGRHAIADAAQGFMTAFPDLVVTMDDIAVQQEHVVFRWTLTGTNSGPGGTGNRVRISGFEEWTIAPDGLVADSKGHYDQAEYERQLKSR